MLDTPNLTIDDVKQAHERIRPYIHRTPVLTSTYLNELTGAVALAQVRKLDNIITTLHTKKKKFKGKRFWDNDQIGLGIPSAGIGGHIFPFTLSDKIPKFART